MKLRLIITILLLLSTLVRAPSLVAPSAFANEVIITGATYTNKDLLRRYIPITDGSLLTDTQIRLAEERLYALNIAANAKVSRVSTPDGSRVLARINDGQGFVVEPIEFTVGSIINLMLGNVKLVYHNFNGLAINPYAEYNISTGETYLGTQTPGLFLPVYHDVGYHVHTDTYPSSLGEFTVDKNEIYWETSYIPAPGWKPRVKVTRSFQRTKPLASAQWAKHSANIYEFQLPYKYTSPHLSYGMSFTYSAGDSSSLTGFQQRLGEMEVLFRDEPYSLRLGASLGSSSASTPVDRLFYLGGDELQRGYEARSFSGQALASSEIEVGYRLVPDSIELKAFAQVSQVAPSLHQFSGKRIKTSLGMGLELPSPGCCSFLWQLPLRSGTLGSP